MNKKIKPITTDAFLDQVAQWQDESISASNENHHEKKSENIQRRFKGPDLIRFYALLQDSGLTKSEYIRRKLLDEPLCPREDRDALAMNTVELIRLKNEVAKLSLTLDSLIKQGFLDQYSEEIVKKTIIEIEHLKEDIHREVRKRWQF